MCCVLVELPFPLTVFMAVMYMLPAFAFSL
jgi:hypothetical protein